jgi:hypothetical protein
MGAIAGRIEHQMLSLDRDVAGRGEIELPHRSHGASLADPAQVTDEYLSP